MGGHGSGRRPDLVKQLTPAVPYINPNIASVGGEPLILPNYSGVKVFGKIAVPGQSDLSPPDHKTTLNMTGSGGTTLTTTPATNTLNIATASGTTYTAGTGLTLTGTEFTTNDSQINHNALQNYVANQHTNWSASSAGTIDPSNYVNTTYVNSDWNILSLSGYNASTVNFLRGDGAWITPPDTNTQLTEEQVEDFVGGMVTGNTETLITVTYQDSDGTLDFVVDNNLANYSNSSSGFITATLTNEQVQDIAGGMVTGNTETLITVTYQDSDGTIDFVVDNNLANYDNSSSGFITATLTNEQVQDIAGGMVTGNTETLITVTYQDSDGTLDFVVDNNLANYDNSSSGFITATLTNEQVEDIVGGMLGGTETGITVTYQDGTGDIDFVVSDTTVAGDSGSTGITPGDTLTIAGGTNITTAMSGDTLTITGVAGAAQDLFNTVAVSGQDNIVADTATDTLTFVAGTNVTLTTNAGTDSLTITASDTNTTYTAGTGITLTGTEFTSNDGQIVHNNLSGYVVNRHIDWTASSAGTIDPSNYVDTNTQLSQEQVDDFVDNLIIAGTNITKVYNDGAGTLTLSSADTNTHKFKENTHFSRGSSFSAVSTSKAYPKIGEVNCTSTKALCAIRGGSLVGISINYDVGSTSGKVSALNMNVDVNGTTVWQNTIDKDVGLNKEEFFTQSEGTDTFDEGDTITVNFEAAGISTPTVNIANVIISLEYYYDD